MNIEKISVEENNLLKLVHQYKGDMDLMLIEMGKDGIFKKYSDIHKEFVELATNGHNIEALKRAIFIQWYSLSEPSIFSGIRDLSESNEMQAIKLLEKIISESQIDSEFISMLFHYKEVNDIAFTRFSNFRNLIIFLKNIPRQDGIEELKNNCFNERGLLGEYWDSLLN